jgi:hypothetical protein
MAIQRLCVGQSRVSLKFTRRSDDRTAFEVMERDGPRFEPRDEIACILDGQRARVATRP